MTVVVTSDFPTTENADVLKLLSRLGPDLKIAWIPPQTDLAAERLPMVREQFARLGAFHLEYVDIDRDMDEKRLKKLADYRVIYLSGGDPIFRDNLIASGLGDALSSYSAQGRIIIGASGGAMQLTPNVSLFRLQWFEVDQVLSERDQFEAAGLVEFELLPHFNRSSDDFLKKVARYSRGLPHEIIALADGASAIVEDGVMSIVGMHARFQNGEQYN